MKLPPRHTKHPRRMKLNRRNYYSNRANWQFQSATWFKKFMICEAEALAELKGEWEPDEDNTALLVGNYLHSYFESPYVHGAFKRRHPEIISTRGSTKGQLKKDYQVADQMIETLKSDPAFAKYYQGDKEVIVTGTIGGVEWMGKLDCFPNNRKSFIDLKTTQSITKKVWVEDNREYGNFIEAYRYPLQMAVYQELIRQQYDVTAVPIIAAVSKQDPPDHALVKIPQDLLDYWLDKIETLQPRIEAVKNGETKPTRCEHCAYCRATKRLTGIIDLYDLTD